MRVDISTQKVLDQSYLDLLKERVSECEEDFIWHLDFGFHHHYFSFSDTLKFASLEIGLKWFFDHVYPLNRTKVCLYKGAFNENFSSKDCLSYDDWREDLVDSPTLRRNYASFILSEYLITLIAPFAESVNFEVYMNLLLLDSLAERAFLISNERFLHINSYEVSSGITFLREEESLSQAIVIPSKKVVDYGSIDIEVEKVKEEGKDLYFLMEHSIMDQRNVFDTLIVNTKNLSDIGKRMLEGYIASDGKVVFYNSLNLLR